MPKVSIVIVSYNVCYFLKQCLQSVLNSVTEAELEIIVVDNASRDGSVSMLKSEFPEAICIENRDNKGFSKANNQGFKKASGDYVLILNPDTIVEENTIQTCLEFYRQTENIGALGVRMFDGSGEYLPESKRGFPTPLRSLYKLTGLSRIFESSPRFNGYYLGHLNADEVQKVEVLTGAFFFTERSILNQLGGFDEDYFMYGEDIELSYQINALGKDIYYVPTTSIIHFKGESTRKNSLAYLRSFYGAMQIYAGKRHTGSSRLWKWVLNAGIILAALSRFVRQLFVTLLWPLINVASIFALTRVIQHFWALLYFKDANYYDNASSTLSTLVLSVLMVFCYYLMGHFDRRFKFKQWIYAAVFSALVLLSTYALFPTDWRFSRSVLLILVALSPILMYFLRAVFNKMSFQHFRGLENLQKRVLIIGHNDSYETLKGIIKTAFKASDEPFHYFMGEQTEKAHYIKEISEIVEARRIGEIIFCSGDITNEMVFGIISAIGQRVEYKIASNDNAHILGSNSKDDLGEWYTLNIDFKINREFHARTKRIIDICFSVLFTIFSPLLILVGKKRIVMHIPSVLAGATSWISYRKDEKSNQLPVLKKGVFSINISHGDHLVLDNHQQNLFYARNYSIWMEMEQVLIHLFARSL